MRGGVGRKREMAGRGARVGAAGSDAEDRDFDSGDCIGKEFKE